MTGPETPMLDIATSTAWLNGRFLPLAEAQVPVLDRGFLFGDGVYEVIPVYGGRLLRPEAHLERLGRSLAATAIPDPHDRSGWMTLLGELIERNGGGDLGLYLQVTRGVAAKRDHAIPDRIIPTVFAMVMPMASRPAEIAEHGITAVTLPDTRWDLCHIKAITLLPNVLLKHEAAARGAAEALLVRDGHVIEATASNVFAIFDGTVVTPPLAAEMLSGVTRSLVLELAAEDGIATEERPLPVARLAACDELWVSSSTREVSPVTTLDGRPVGNGRPGPLWQRIDALYQAHKDALRRSG